MAGKSDFTERLARIEARHDAAGPDMAPEMLAGTPDTPLPEPPQPKRRWGAATLYMCLGLGLVGAAVMLTLNKLERDTPGTKALIAERLSNGEPVNVMEILTRANASDVSWQDAQNGQQIAPSIGTIDSNN